MAYAKKPRKPQIYAFFVYIEFGCKSNYGTAIDGIVENSYRNVEGVALCNFIHNILWKAGLS